MQRAKNEMAALVAAHDGSGATTASASALSAAQQTHDYRFNFGLSITISYNLGLLYERLVDMSRAESVYKGILLQTPHYIDCAYFTYFILTPSVSCISFSFFVAFSLIVICTYRVFCVCRLSASWLYGASSWHDSECK